MSGLSWQEGKRQVSGRTPSVAAPHVRGNAYRRGGTVAIGELGLKGGGGSSSVLREQTRARRILGGHAPPTSSHSLVS